MLKRMRQFCDRSRVDSPGVTHVKRPLSTVNTLPNRCICGARLEILNQNGLVTRREWGGFVSDIHYCAACDHIQFYPIPSDAVLNSYYQADFFGGANAFGNTGYTIDDSNHYWGDSSGHLPHLSFLSLLRRLREGTFRHGTPVVHDFGCGFGTLVSRLAEFGFDASGSDPDAGTVQEAKKQHLRVSVGGVAELAAQNEQYDLITGYHCLEHLPDPYGFFQAANRALKPGGLLVMASPSGAYGPARSDYFGRYDWCFFPAHLHYFSPRSLRKAADTTGFEITYLETQSFADEQLDWAVLSMTGRNSDQLRESEAIMTFLDRNLLARDLRFVMCKSRIPIPDSISQSIVRLRNTRVIPGRTSEIGTTITCSLKALECRKATNVLTLLFTTSQPLHARYKVVLHAQSGEGASWTENRLFHNLDFWPYPDTSEWPTGQDIELKIPFDMPPGTYKLRTGLYDTETNSTFEGILVETGEVTV